MEKIDISDIVKKLQDSLDSIFFEIRTKSKYQHFCLGVDLSEEEKNLKCLCEDFKNILSDLFRIQNKLGENRNINSNRNLDKIFQLESEAKKLINEIKIQKDTINWG